MNKRHYEHTLPNIRGSLSNTYEPSDARLSNDAVIHGFNDFMTQCRHSPVIRIPASPLKRIRDGPPG